ncbi:hypothetical protein V0U79_12120 [Hyphobacterium sp. HN65]|uniref:Uncharacterized protein n=1 Tax=Hyphobacterium lacteum TaxID=3116575 RepID=A0ABU7LU05_9PROT|nr:hypothetical protein [Hyphobacterium sp. HN65]MEE2527116.1 hypothetical protein [Hyphobacterium sp. HN65]
MNVSYSLAVLGLAFGFCTAALIWMDAGRTSEQMNDALRRPLAETWAKIYNSSVWGLPKLLLRMFLNGVERWNNSIANFFEKVSVAALIAILVLIVEQFDSGLDANRDLRWISTTLTFGTFFIFRIHGVGRWRDDLGRRGHWLWWPMIAILSAMSLVATFLHVANFVALFNRDLTVLQALLYLPILMMLLRWTYMRALVFPLIRIFDWDTRRRNRDYDEFHEYLTLQEELESNAEIGEEVDEDDIMFKAEIRAWFKHKKKANKLLRRFFIFKKFFNIMQSGFLVGTVLTVIGLYVGLNFDASSELALTPQILIVNTAFDALTIGVTIFLMQWVHAGRFWTFRLLIAVPIDLAIAAIFSVASIYLSLIGTEHSLTLGQSFDLLIPDVVGDHVLGLGPEFWIMHTTFIPTAIYMLVLFTGAIMYLMFNFLPSTLLSEDPNEIRQPLRVLAAFFGFYTIVFEILAFFAAGYQFSA